MSWKMIITFLSRKGVRVIHRPIYPFYRVYLGQGTNVSGSDDSFSVKRTIETSDMFADMIRNFFPDNVITACFQKTQTKYTHIPRAVAINGTNNTVLDAQKILSSTSGLNILGLMVVCLMFGITASSLGERVELFIKFFETISILVIHLLNWIIWWTPIGGASLIITALLKASDIESMFISMGMFVLAHSIGTAFHQLIIIPLIYFISTRKNPLYFLGSCLRPWLTVFAPPSSVIGIPDMLKTLDENLHVDPRVSHFFVPVTVTLCRCGSCIFICLSALFLAQLDGMTFNASKVVIIGLLSSVGSLAIPPLPSGSIIAVLVILASFDIDAHNVGLLMALEWYNDRIRTTSNTMATLLGAVVVEKLCQTSLRTDQESNKHKQTSEKPLYDSEIHALVGNGEKRSTEDC